jgi:hypothetical protein
MACGGPKYFTYEETIQKLEEAGYTVIGQTDKDEILETLTELAESYNKYVERENREYNVSLSEMDPNTTNVESLILAKKDDDYAFIFYCEDEESAMMIGYAINEVYGSKIGEQMAEQDKNFVFLYTVAVNDILKYRDY